MRVLVWIVEDTWQIAVTAAAALPADADITLLYVSPSDAEAVARCARHGLLGRPHGPSSADLQSISEQSAGELLAAAETLLGRQATLMARRGRVEHEVIAAAEGMDLLVLARGGEPEHRGPRSLGRAARFVVDHAPCAVLLADGPSSGGGSPAPG